MSVLTNQSLTLQRMTAGLFRLLVVLCLTACQNPPSQPSAKGVEVVDITGKPVRVTDVSRLVTIGTSITETVVALGAAAKVVGVDEGSAKYLPQVAQSKRVGPFRTIAVEGVLSLKPTLVVANGDAGPPEALAQIRMAGIPVLVLPVSLSLEAVKTKTLTLGKALGAENQSQTCISELEREMAAVTNLLNHTTKRPTVVFCARGPNMPTGNLSGTGTAIDLMISLAGGENPIHEFTGFRPMTDEAMVVAAPEILLMTETGFTRSGGIDGVLTLPGVALTPAGKNRRVIPVSDLYTLGFGPGIGKAVHELALKFHPELNTNPQSENR